MQGRYYLIQLIRVAAGFRPGRGLKQVLVQELCIERVVAAGFRPGRGLKR